MSNLENRQELVLKRNEWKLELIRQKQLLQLWLCKFFARHEVCIWVGCAFTKIAPQGGKSMLGATDSVSVTFLVINWSVLRIATLIDM